MFKFLKKILKKEEKEYTVIDFENDIFNIKNKNKSKIIEYSFSLYEFFYLIISVILFLSLFVITFYIENNFKINNFISFIFSFCILGGSFFSLLFFINHHVNNFLIKKKYKKISNKIIFKKILEMNYSTYNGELKDEFDILYENEVFYFMAYLSNEEKLKVFLKLKELNYDFNKNVNILNHYIDSKIELAFKNDIFKDILLSMNKEILYQNINKEIIDILKSTDSTYIYILDELFNEYETYQKDKLFYKTKQKENINNILNPVLSF